MVPHITQSLSQSLSQSLTQSLTLTLSLTYSLSLSHTHTHTHSLSLSHSLTLSLTHSLTHSHSLSHSLSLSLFISSCSLAKSPPPRLLACCRLSREKSSAEIEIEIVPPPLPCGLTYFCATEEGRHSTRTRSPIVNLLCY
jgi:hypothetical protein